MKKIVVFLFCSFLLWGCSSSMQLVMQPLYGTAEKTYKDINGDFTVYRLLLNKITSLASNAFEYIILNRTVAPKMTYYTIEVVYISDSWRFMTNLQIKIDEKYYNIKDDNPDREVGDGGTVTERLHVPLTYEQIFELSNCSSLVFQYFAEPIAIPAEGITAIKRFINS